MNPKRIDYQLRSKRSDFLTQLQKSELVNCSLLEATPSIATDIHVHPHILHMSYVLKGRGKCQVASKVHDLIPHSVHFVYPNEPHAFVADERDPYHVVFVKLLFRGKVPVGFPRMISPAKNRKKVARLFLDLESYFQAGDSSSNALRRSATLYLLLAEIIDIVDLHQLAEVTTHPDHISENFAEQLEELQSPPFEFPGLDHLAAQCHMSRRNYCEVFRKATHSSPKEFFLNARMAYAKRLVDAEHDTVAQIAERCNYANAQNFIRQYKAYFGTTPAQKRP